MWSASGGSFDRVRAVTVRTGTGTGRGVETGVDLTLLNRYYERYADHAVNVANRVIFLATGADADM